jgi:hypothetical protein
LTTPKTERGIIRRLLRQLAKHPRSKKLRKALLRHRQILAHMDPPLRLKAWRQMQELIDAHVTEQGGNNVGRAVERIIRANGGVPGEPWCGDTVAACYLWAGAKSVTRAWAAVRLLERLLTRVHHPRRGHVVTYTFDHTGLFDRWAPEIGPGYFYAGEGNTGDAGAVSDSRTGGDGVKLKLRHASQVAGFWRVLR